MMKFSLSVCSNQERKGAGFSEATDSAMAAVPRAQSPSVKFFPRSSASRPFPGSPGLRCGCCPRPERPRGGRTVRRPGSRWCAQLVRVPPTHGCTSSGARSGPACVRSCQKPHTRIGTIPGGIGRGSPKELQKLEARGIARVGQAGSPGPRPVRAPPIAGLPSCGKVSRPCHRADRMSPVPRQETCGPAPTAGSGDPRTGLRGLPTLPAAPTACSSRETSGPTPARSRDPPRSWGCSRPCPRADRMSPSRETSRSRSRQSSDPRTNSRSHSRRRPETRAELRSHSRRGQERPAPN